MSPSDGSDKVFRITLVKGANRLDLLSIQQTHLALKCCHRHMVMTWSPNEVAEATSPLQRPRLEHSAIATVDEKYGPRRLARGGNPFAAFRPSDAEWRVRQRWERAKTRQCIGFPDLNLVFVVHDRQEIRLTVPIYSWAVLFLAWQDGCLLLQLAV